MELHMDWHFRMNRKAREQGSQIQSRLWFLKASEWIQNQAPLQKYPAFFESSPSSSTSSTSTSSSRTHSPSLTFNVCKAPVSTSTSGGKQPVIQCHVCKDTLDIVFDEQEDDWILKEAVEVKDLYYHRLCWMDWMKQTISQKAAGRKSKLTIEDDSLPTVLPNGTNHASLLQEVLTN
ncbi:hypothetical protein HMI54_012456 [Coelomomyces lativittatus]|nr:hypothetical protein HMI54_012456 [Coelomomyces lativittatus]KAJ1500198.1 hypothetical protein HMI55_004001 [Coelomomyces lativittatus]